MVDINRASGGDISTTLGVPSEPTVTRIIALRPWLKGSDLSSVPGIGPEMIPAIAPKVCATQPTLPPVPKMQCRAGSPAVDLQTAPASTMAARLRLPATTAQALVAARPLPQDLRQVITPRVPGLSGPTLATLIRAGAVCVRPAPMYAAGASYRWVTGAEGAVVSRGDYVLFVPPGRVTAPDGAYASVTPLPAADGILPRADAHIHGSWAVGTSTVAIQIPAPQGAADLTPVVLHDAVPGDVNASVGAAVWSGVGESGATVYRAQFTSLSELSSGGLECEGLMSLVPACGGTFDEQSIREWSGTSGINDVNDLLDSGWARPCPSSGYALAAGTVRYSLTCDVAKTTQTATWTIKDTPPIAILHPGFIYNVRIDGQPSKADQTLDDLSALTSLVNLLAGDAVVPGEKVTVTVPRGGQRIVATDVDAASTVGYLLVSYLLTWLPPSTSIELALLPPPSSWSDLETLVRSAVELALETSGGVAAETLLRMFKVIDGAVYISAALETIHLRDLGPTSVTLRNLNPPSPPAGGGGTAGPGPDGTIGAFIPGTLHRVGSYNQARSENLYQVWEQGGDAQGTSDPDEAACLSRRHVLRDYTNGGLPWTQESVTALECDRGEPEITIGPTARNWILRESSGTAWFIDGNGQLGHIKDGNQYIACAQSYYVLDYIPRTIVEQIAVASQGDSDPNTAPRASCG